MKSEPPRHRLSRRASLERAAQRELHRPVEHHFTSPRVTPVDRAARAASRAPQSS